MFNRVQILMGRKDRPCPQKNIFAYTGFIRCGECDCMITAEIKTKYIKSAGKTQQYTYCHCARKDTLTGNLSKIILYAYNVPSKKLE